MVWKFNINIGKIFKFIEKQLETMNLILETKPEQVDEEKRRKIYLTSVKYWINKSIDDIKVINGKLD